MVHSTWGDWFRRDVLEAAEPEGLAIWYLGCNGFVLRTPETTVYVDPYFGDGDPPGLLRMIPVPLDPASVTECDHVLVTHEHVDHMHAPSLRPLVEHCDATVHAPSASFTDPQYEYDDDVPAANRDVVEVGDVLELGDLTVHVRAANDPDALDPVSFVVEHESGTYVNSGDSRACEAFAEVGEAFDVDVASLTFGTVGRVRDGDETVVADWYADEGTVIENANRLRADRLVPCHWDMWKGVGGRPESLVSHAASFTHPRSVEFVTVGDRFRVDRPGVDSPGLAGRDAGDPDR
ncbi:MAG: MBL fold metallo-hydrolase [Halobacteriaceae archaeon]